MLLIAHAELAAARLRRLPGTWLAAIGFACLGPLLNAFDREAPIGDLERVSLHPWLFFAALSGALLGTTLIRDTEHARRASLSRVPGDLVLIAAPTLGLTLTALASLELSGFATEWALSLAGALHMATLATLLYPAGTLAILAVTWLVPPLLPMINLTPITPLGSVDTPLGATISFALALLALTSIRPNALRSPR